MRPGLGERATAVRSTKTRLGIVLTAQAALLCAQDPPLIRTETRVVQIDVEVSSPGGSPVTDLSRDSFTVTDNGKAREIRIFRVEPRVDSGTAKSPPRRGPDLPPNVFSNLTPDPRSSGHATVILLDGINNYWDQLVATRLRLLEMIGKLQREERIALYAASTRPAGIVLLQDFTTDRARLQRSIEAYTPPAVEPAPGIYGPPRVPQLPDGPPTPAIPVGEDEVRRRTAMLDTMSSFRLLAEHLGKLPGRKSVLWITSGLPPRQMREMPDPFEKTVSALNEANIAVHVMDDGGVGGPHRRWGREAERTLRQLAESTGGKAYVGRNDLENALTEAIESPRVTYVLGFYLADGERDDRFHRLAVRVNRPGLKLGYRQGYFAGAIPKTPPPEKREALENALLDPQDSSHIAMAAELIEVPGAQRPAIRVEIRLGAQDLSLRRHEKGLSGEVEELFLLTNAEGQLVGRLGGSKKLEVKQLTADHSTVEVIPLTQEMTLPEGAARLRLVIRDTKSGRTGSLSMPLSGVNRLPQQQRASPN
jgi:VWFA-related protein